MLTEEQAQILAYMARTKAPEYDTAVWIAEGCGHFYDTPWAAKRLPGLIKHGLIERLARGAYRITEAGRRAIKAANDGSDG